MNQAKIEENQQVQRRKRVKSEGNKYKETWKLGDLQLKFSHYLPNYLSPTLQSLNTSLILKVEFTYISGDQYEKQAYGTLTNSPRKLLED